MSDLEQKFLQEVTDKAAEAKLVCGWMGRIFWRFCKSGAGAGHGRARHAGAR